MSEQVLPRIKARDLLNYQATELWDILTGRFVLIFDDGEFATNAYETIYSTYAWDFHRNYPETPLLQAHHLRFFTSKRRFSVSVDLGQLGACMWAVYDTYGSARVKLDPDLTAMAAVIGNKQYVEVTARTGEFAGRLDLLDVMEVLDEPEIFDVNANMTRTSEAVSNAYDVVANVLADQSRLRHNPIARDFRSGLLKPGQVLQCITARGALTDMNSRIFRMPITRGYAEGIRSLYDSMVESRSAAKASYYAAEALKQSEYFSRRLQFVSQTVQNLHHGDCGTVRYLEWTMRDAENDDNGNQVRPSDLRVFHGKLFLGANGKLHPITPKSKNLIGQRIKIRSPLFCAHPDPVGICSTCFGDLSLAVPERTNIGQLASTYMAKQASQNLLSSKHLDTNATLDKIKLTGMESKYVKVGRDNSSYLLSGSIKDKRVQIVIAPEQAQGLMDVLSVESVRDLHERHYTELDSITFLTFDGKVADNENVKVSVNGRMGSFTYEMLEYIRGQRWTITADEEYCIDMSGWDWEDTFIILPQKHFNNSDHVDNVAKMLESRVSEMRKRDKAVVPEKMLQELLDYVNWKLDVNAALIEVIMYSTMIVSAEDNDYSLPKPWTRMSVSVQSKTMEYRSQGVAMAYEDQAELIKSPDSYLVTNRIDHPFDCILMPNETLGQ